MSEYQFISTFQRFLCCRQKKPPRIIAKSEKEIFCEQRSNRLRGDYRFCSRTFIIIFLALFIPMLLSGCWTGYKSANGFRFFSLGMDAICHSLFQSLLRPICPACNRKVEVSVRKFCPECGSSDLTPKSFLLSAKCHSCGVNLRRGKGGRSYKIRCCTHCGVFLDGKGI